MEVIIDEKKMRCENSDRISNLHDSLLIDILSRLKARDVAQTCILSKRWRNLWAFVPSLHFDFAEFRGDAKRFNNFVSSFLRLRDEASNVHAFTLSYSPPCDAEISDRVRTWIMYALECKVKNLTVDLLGKRCWFVPNCFTSDSLEYMHLSGFDMIQPDIVCFPKLRYLRLYRVFTPDYSMQNLISGCPALETLSIEGCNLLMDSISFQTIKSLTIRDCCFHGRSTISISAPCLEYIKFVKGHGRRIAFKGMSNVTKAIFVKPKCDEKDNGFDLLSGISGVKILYLLSFYLKEFLNRQTQICRTFHKLKLLAIGVCCMLCDFGTWYSFLKYCPNLQHLYLVHTEEFCKEDHSGEVNSENLKKIEGLCCQNLKVVRIVCCLSYYGEHQLEQLILQMRKKIDGLQIIVSKHRSN